ncbi:MAG: hypothetical protein KH336_10075, partial [Faecalibacterium prausnitzii]|nr:hypothetical protein [Faecalibacterium prausnitzii]
LRGEWSPEVGRGDSKHPSLPLARAERKPFDRKRKLPRATSARTSSKKKPALPLARAERKPLDRKRKHPPRHRRERQQYTFLMNAIFENCDKLL